MSHETFVNTKPILETFQIVILLFKSQTQVLVSDWGTSEPNNVTTENCVVIAEKPENRGHWADVDCRRQEHFICQKGGYPHHNHFFRPISYSYFDILVSHAKLSSYWKYLSF